MENIISPSFPFLTIITSRLLEEGPMGTVQLIMY